ncbi:AraC family transcriptional regulator [Epibacterium sp. DP7N7-1]|uniref:AraC family transcriptional regulator n=1 Tax=Tritonibacter mobilis F1926 TaxID=1265309 RepID=A0A1B1A1E8_9RHOB|nr:helix-turn-helix domain-containing protein [Tritonibacter mobilis]ANP40409.1 AraC family transcriptional regulator [Tritonibacter mobilis F1926]KJZ25233.1 AraC family transcriptional regulator [Tritonibacter mobilis]MBW3242681.1 AraC family transcriptional regulator [Epibacterium sp. DP7N7-1]
MPFDPNTHGPLDVSPLLRLMSAGNWQIELAHERDCHLVIWVTRGQGRMLLDGQCRGFGPHTAICVPARTLFSLELGRQSIGQVLQIGEDIPCGLPDTPMQIRINDMQEQARINSLFDAALREQQVSDDHTAQAIRSYADLIGIHMQRLWQTAPENSKLSAARKLCRAYCARLAEDSEGAFNMAGHAAALGVTPTHLTRVCRQETGKTAAALLTERQLHAARSLLIRTSLPMRDIAQSLGFGSAAYFTRFITQHTGSTPSALRKKARRPATSASAHH